MSPLAKELFTTDVGLMSLAVIVGIIVIGAWVYVVVRRKMREPGA